jgi:hypothetical protein
LHFVSGKKYGQYEMESFNLNVLGVPPFMLNHFILHALLAASMFIRGESGNIRQAMNASIHLAVFGEVTFLGKISEYNPTQT